MATAESVPQKRDWSSEFLGSANRLRTVPNAQNPFVLESIKRKADHSARTEPEANNANRAAQSICHGH